MRAQEFINEEKLGVTKKRAGRSSDRPARGHVPEPRYKTKQDTTESVTLDERGQASVKLCKSSKSNAELGASATASCKSQGLRAREGDKSHKIGDERVVVGGKKLKGKVHGGKLPDYSKKK